MPVSRDPLPDAYYQATWFEAFQPRGLMGTAAALLGLSGRGFVRLNLAAEAAFLFLLASALQGSLAARGTRAWLAVAAATVLLAFQQVLAFSHFFSGFVDVWSHLLLAMALLSVQALGREGLVAASAFLALSVLNHEKAVCDALLLAAWVAYRQGARRAFAFLAPGLLALGLLAARGSEQTRVGMRFADYLALVPRAAAYLRDSSGSVAGILWAGGLAWLLLGWAALRWLRSAPRRERVRRAAFVAAAVLLCLLPLLVAHDTNRLVGVMWLPTLVLVAESRLLEAAVRSRSGVGVLLAAAVLQLALPPLFVFKHTAVPLNCEAQAAVRAFTRGEPDGEFRALDGWIRLSEDGSHLEGYERRCPALHFVRNSKPGRWF